MDQVLAIHSPQLTASGALEAAHSLFGFSAVSARDLESERDRTFSLEDASGQALAILKVSNAAEDPEILDMEAAAALHVATVDAGIRLALPCRRREAEDGSPAVPGVPGDDLTRLRALWRSDDASHWVRLYDVLPGRSGVDPATLDDEALIAWGEMTARLGLALRAFSHPRSGRKMLWDVQHALAAREMALTIQSPAQRELVMRILEDYAEVVVPVWKQLRAQVVHTDLTVENTLVDDRGLITGIVDFGDMSHTALVTDLASVLDSLAVGREGDELFRLARLVLDGYQRRLELEELELRVLGPLWAARSALTIAISSWRVSQGLEEEGFAERYDYAQRAQVMETMVSLGWSQVAARLGAPAPAPDSVVLARRRAAVFGPTMEPLFYNMPVQVASAASVWITDVNGQRHLDAYNNVPCIGHGHPRVSAAIARQSRRINTHMRYLHPDAIELAERLVALTPPELDTVLLVNSGSEANDLAWRIATAVTGNRGGLCTAFAYHGITEATDALSPESWTEGESPEHVAVWEPPDPYRQTHLDTAEYTSALARLEARGLRPAAAILDGLITSDRIADLDAAYVQELVQLTRAAGALWIADEVQAGHGRTGDAMWAFDRFGVVPDFVTLGKPMGNGHPIAAVITRGEIVQQLAGRTRLFSTFGGNPVSAAAALAVLDVIEDERVVERVRATGEALRAALLRLADDHEAIGDVRVIGLACGVELVADRASRTPDGSRTRAVRESLRRRGVLVGTTGRDGNIIKIRPPLAFTAVHVPVLVDALAGALAETERAQLADPPTES